MRKLAIILLITMVTVNISITTLAVNQPIKSSTKIVKAKTKVQTPTKKIVTPKTTSVKPKTTSVAKPTVVSRGMQKKVVSEGRATYSANQISYVDITTYSAIGYYLDKTFTKKLEQASNIKFINGIPQTFYDSDKKYHYNPVTIEQYALGLYNRYLSGEDTKDKFLATSSWLLTYMDTEGALRCNFPYKGYLSGWVSSMAQGEALSVFVRAYNLTNDENYKTASSLVFDYLIDAKNKLVTNITDIDSKFGDNLFFQEYPIDTNSLHKYTLNGFIYTLIGVYDWSTITDSYLVSVYFNNGISTLKILLPYYDIGGFSAYDLDYLFTNKYAYASADYHAVHIELLGVLYSITSNEVFNYFKTLWLNYVS
jgi:heparosan-N-sulfate-glucuronate 5-epimerase